MYTYAAEDGDAVRHQRDERRVALDDPVALLALRERVEEAAVDRAGDADERRRDRPPPQRLRAEGVGVRRLAQIDREAGDVGDEPGDEEEEARAEALVEGLGELHPLAHLHLRPLGDRVRLGVVRELAAPAAEHRLQRRRPPQIIGVGRDEQVARERGEVDVDLAAGRVRAEQRRRRAGARRVVVDERGVEAADGLELELQPLDAEGVLVRRKVEPDEEDEDEDEVEEEDGERDEVLPPQVLEERDPLVLLARLAQEDHPAAHQLDRQRADREDERRRDQRVPAVLVEEHHLEHERRRALDQVRQQPELAEAQVLALVGAQEAQRLGAHEAEEQHEHALLGPLLEALLQLGRLRRPDVGRLLAGVPRHVRDEAEQVGHHRHDQEEPEHVVLAEELELRPDADGEVEPEVDPREEDAPDRAPELAGLRELLGGVAGAGRAVAHRPADGAPERRDEVSVGSGHPALHEGSVER
jgi:hypothetical protein